MRTSGVSAGCSAGSNPRTRRRASGVKGRMNQAWMAIEAAFATANAHVHPAPSPSQGSNRMAARSASAAPTRICTRGNAPTRKIPCG